MCLLVLSYSLQWQTAEWKRACACGVVDMNVKPFESLFLLNLSHCKKKNVTNYSVGLALDIIFTGAPIAMTLKTFASLIWLNLPLRMNIM